MIKIYLGGELISCSQQDTFVLDVESPDGFEEGTTIRFQVAENEEDGLIIDSVYEQQQEGFKILLSDQDRAKLKQGNYIYRIIAEREDGNIITRKSGELEVRWGV